MWSLVIAEDLKIEVPCCGAGALIYYQGYSEPETARFVQGFLRPGMVFFDVGAHIGEYSLLASRRVGPSGEVHAFEPQPDTFALLTNNVSLNGLRNIRLNACAVSDREATAEFAVCSEPSLSAILGSGGAPGGGDLLCTLSVPTQTLDGYCREQGCWPDLIKIDVEGAELLVLEGMGGILSEPAGRAPCLVIELDTGNYRRFGYGFGDLMGILSRSGYLAYSLDRAGVPRPHDPEQVRPDKTENIVASKTELPVGRGHPL